MSSTEGSEMCVWCTSGAVGNACYKESDAQGLPASVFKCEFPSLKANSGDVCNDYTTQSQCIGSEEDGEKCAWCTSGAVGNTCFKESDAQTLPASVFHCEYDAAAKLYASNTCNDLTSESACMAGEENGVKCSWCTSGAVGNSCFTETDAKTLPTSVFHCEYDVLAASATEICNDLTSEDACMAGSEGSEQCAWCTSGAVGNSCFTESDAKTLPASVFHCEYNSWLVNLVKSAMEYFGL